MATDVQLRAALLSEKKRHRVKATRTILALSMVAKKRESECPQRLGRTKRVKSPVTFVVPILDAYIWRILYGRKVHKRKAAMRWKNTGMKSDWSVSNIIGEGTVL